MKCQQTQAGWRWYFGKWIWFLLGLLTVVAIAGAATELYSFNSQFKKAQMDRDEGAARVIQSLQELGRAEQANDMTGMTKASDTLDEATSGNVRAEFAFKIMEAQDRYQRSAKLFMWYFLTALCLGTLCCAASIYFMMRAVKGETWLRAAILGAALATVNTTFIVLAGTLIFGPEVRHVLSGAWEIEDPSDVLAWALLGSSAIIFLMCPVIVGGGARYAELAGRNALWGVTFPLPGIGVVILRWVSNVGRMGGVGLEDTGPSRRMAAADVGVLRGAIFAIHIFLILFVGAMIFFLQVNRTVASVWALSDPHKLIDPLVFVFGVAALAACPVAAVSGMRIARRAGYNSAWGILAPLPVVGLSFLHRVSNRAD